MFNGKISFTPILLDGPKIDIESVGREIAKNNYLPIQEVACTEDIVKRYFVSPLDELEEDYVKDVYPVYSLNAVCASVLIVDYSPETKVLKRAYEHELAALEAQKKSLSYSRPGVKEKDMKVGKDERIFLKQQVTLGLARETKPSFKTVPFILFENGLLLVGAKKPDAIVSFILDKTLFGDYTTSHPFMHIVDSVLGKIVPFSVHQSQSAPPKTGKEFAVEFCTWLAMKHNIGSSVTAICEDGSSLTMKTKDIYGEIPKQAKGVIFDGGVISGIEIDLGKDYFGSSGEETCVIVCPDGFLKGIDPHMGRAERAESFELLSGGCRDIVSYVTEKMAEFVRLRQNSQMWSLEVNKIK